MGLALLIVVLKIAGAADRRRALGRRGAVLDPDLRHQLRRRRRHRHPDGVPVRHELGGVLEVRRRRHRPDARDGGDVRVLPRVELPRPARLRRAAARAGAATSLAALALFAGSWLSGYFIICTNAFMQHPVGHAVGADGALQLATSGRSCSTPGRSRSTRTTWWPRSSPASFVVAAVGALLRARRACIASRRDVFLRVGVIAGLVVERARCISDRRPAGQARRAIPAGEPRRDGRAVRERPARPASSSSASRT